MSDERERIVQLFEQLSDQDKYVAIRFIEWLIEKSKDDVHD